MIDVDGGDGGGQVVRTALSLSALSGDPVRIENVRGGRSTPGLRPQHLAAVRVLAAITGANVSGAREGSETLVFRPGTIRPGNYGVDVGTAGSLTLLFDAVLPLAVGIDRPLAVAGRGGTDVKWSPPTAHYRRVKLPLLARSGVVARCEVQQAGFYPEGGGVATLRMAPSPPAPSVSLAAPGSLEGARVYSMAAESLADADVATRQAVAAADALEDAGVEVVERVVRRVDSDSPGSAVTVRLDYERSLAGFDALGERGKPAEEVGTEAAEGALSFHQGPGAVDRHTADQVIPFLAVGGGRVAIPEVTGHVEAALDLVSTFGYDVRVEGSSRGPVLVG